MNQNQTQLLQDAELSLFKRNPSLSAPAFVASQLKGRGAGYTAGSFSETGRKILRAEVVNDVALVVLSRVNLTEAPRNGAGEVPKGFQITAYDLSGNVLSETPLDGTAPKGTNKANSVFGDVVTETEGRSDLIAAAIQSALDVAEERVEKLRGLLSQVDQSEELAEAA